MTPPFAQTAIITRTKNRPLLLKRAIKSVLSQSNKGWFHVIINDGGDKKDVDALVAEHKKDYNGRVEVIHNPKSQGMEAASNKAIKACDSTYVVIHDDDDSWDKHFLKKMVNHLEKHDLPGKVAGAVCYSTRIDEKMTVKKVSEISRKDFNGGVRGITLWDVCARNLFPPISFLYQREVFEGIGYYDESMPVLGDWEFNLRFLQHYDIVLVPEHLAFYHHRVPEDSSDYANTVVGAIDTHETYQTYMRNKLLRDDMEQGKVGVGYLINLSRDLFSTQAKFDYDHHMHAENHKILMKQGKNMHKLNEHVASHHRATTATLEKSQKLLKENNTLLNVQKEKVAIIYHRIDKLVGLLRPFRKKQNQ